MTLLGAGSYGCALAIMYSNDGHKVNLWTHSKEKCQTLKENRKIDRLGGFILPEKIKIFCDIDEAIGDNKTIIIATPTDYVRETLKKIKTDVSKKKIVCVAKGFENGSGYTMENVINEESNFKKVYIMSGPSHAEEVIKRLPTTNVIAAKKTKWAKKMIKKLSTSYFRLYANNDMVGVQLGGAIKNVIAITSGISDGLGFGDNAKAAIMTRGIAEMKRLGKLMGAKEKTFSGLSGIGDIIVTCTSEHSRNRRFGKRLALGEDKEYILNDMKMVVEGVNTSKTVYELMKRYNVDMPLCEETYKIIHKNKEPKKVLIDLMTRKYKHEYDDIYE